MDAHLDALFRDVGRGLAAGTIEATLDVFLTEWSIFLPLVVHFQSQMLRSKTAHLFGVISPLFLLLLVVPECLPVHHLRILMLQHFESLLYLVSTLLLLVQHLSGCRGLWAGGF